MSVHTILHNIIISTKQLFISKHQQQKLKPLAQNNKTEYIITVIL